MAVDDMEGLLKHELGDLLYAERVFLKGLKQMSKETRNPVVRDRIVRHAEETQEHIGNLELAFESIGYKPRAQRCAASIGLDEERQSFKDEKNPAPNVLEAFNLGAGLKVEHYEIAGYRSAIQLARIAGREQCAALLQKNLDQEVAMATFLEQTASNALAQLEDEWNDGDGPSRTPG